GNPDLANPGVLGLEWPGGYGRLGEVIEDSGDRVERRLEMMAGVPPAASARIDSFAFPPDPLLAHGIAYEDVSYEGEAASYPAWYVPGSSDTWVIAVHGRTATRAEAL